MLDTLLYIFDVIENTFGVLVQAVATGSVG
jgi:hypothetical protein